MGKKLGIKARTNKPFGLDNLLSGTQNTEEEINENKYSSNENSLESAINHNNIEEEKIEIINIEDNIESDQKESKKSVGRPKTNTKVVKRSAEIGTIDGELRYTAIINEDLLNEVKKIAYWERLKMKDMFNFALESFINDYKVKHGDIKDIPSRKKI